MAAAAWPVATDTCMVDCTTVRDSDREFFSACLKRRMASPSVAISSSNRVAGYLRRDVAVGQPAQRLGHAAQRSDDAQPDEGNHGYQGQQGQRSADGADAQPFFAQLGGARRPPVR